MADMGLGLGLGAGSAVDTLQEILKRRIAQQQFAQQFAEQQRAAQAHEAFQQQQLAEQSKQREATLDATKAYREGIQQDREAKQNEQNSKDTFAAAEMLGGGVPINDTLHQKFHTYGVPHNEGSQTAPGVLLTGMKGVAGPTEAAQPPAGIADPGQLVTTPPTTVTPRKQEQSQASIASKEGLGYDQHEIEREKNDQAWRATLAKIAAGADKKSEKLTRVEHMGDDGRPVIDYLTDDQIRSHGPFKGKTDATTSNRLASAQAVQQTGNDMINELSDPRVKATLGPALGRYSTLKEFIGNPPPEFAHLAGQVESYALANMGVHGMRSSQGAQMISSLLNAKHTPESMIQTIRGLNSFSEHFMQNEGRGSSVSGDSGGSPANRVYYDVNGNPVKR